MLGRICFLIGKSIFVRMADLIGDTHLGVGELLRLGVVSLLPSELLGETVSQPDIEINNLVSTGNVDFTTSQELFHFMVSVHQSPSIVSYLTFQDSADDFTHWTLW